MSWQLWLVLAVIVVLIIALIIHEAIHDRRAKPETDETCASCGSLIKASK